MGRINCIFTAFLSQSSCFSPARPIPARPLLLAHLLAASLPFRAPTWSTSPGRALSSLLCSIVFHSFKLCSTSLLHWHLLRLILLAPGLIVYLSPAASSGGARDTPLPAVPASTSLMLGGAQPEGAPAPKQRSKPGGAQQASSAGGRPGRSQEQPARHLPCPPSRSSVRYMALQGDQGSVLLRWTKRGAIMWCLPMGPKSRAQGLESSWGMLRTCPGVRET